MAKAAVNTAEYYQSVIDKNEGKTFHDRELERMKADPSNGAYKAAMDYAKKLHEKRMLPIRDFNQPGHEKALKEYVDRFGGDESKVKQECINDACNLFDAAPFEMKNGSIESGLINGFQGRSADDAAFVAKYRNLAQLKIAAEGYKGLNDFTREFFNTHPFSEEAKRSMPIHPHDVCN